MTTRAFLAINRDVVVGLTWRDRAVVAIGTCPQNRAMFDPNIGEAGRHVAVVTGVCRGDVVRGLAARPRTCVACLAFLIDLGVIKCKRNEVPRGVAVGAIVAGWRVVSGLAARAGAVVTRHTVTRRAGKPVIDVAGLADDLCMSTRQGKACVAGMIKSGNRLYSRNTLLCAALRGKHDEQKQRNECVKEKAPHRPSDRLAGWQVFHSFPTWLKKFSGVRSVT